MGIRRGSISTPIIADGLVFNVDAANRASYIPDATTSFNTLDLSQSGSLQDTGMYSSENEGTWVFDGVDDYIDTGNTISFNYNDPFTVSAWVKTNAVSGYKTIYYKFDTSISGGRGIIIRLYSVCGSCINIVYFDLYSTNAGSTSTRKRITTGTGTIVDHDIWYLLTATYDGSGVGSGMKIYLNEVPQTVTVTQDNLQSGDITNSLNALIGATYTPSYVFNGNIANSLIYNRALSSNEVLHNYNALKGRFS